MCHVLSLYSPGCDSISDNNTFDIFTFVERVSPDFKINQFEELRGTSAMADNGEFVNYFYRITCEIYRSFFSCMIHYMLHQN